ncbi:hypothetical protein POM88_034226 [Heracleum sosnowskyi]|uniref:FBD domain-containing protein n=1 Tax=Heracleum sosnowskyi TaxID=360622 RepID=A0AAD8MCY6_9APIA|nr:hypothetical protein POM88_034226 [Heracleum sosnowskyi]
MRSAPNLYKLHIKAGFTKDAVQVNLKDYLVEDCTMDHLEIVTFNFLKGFRAELELVKFILARSLLLKTTFLPRVGVIKKDVALLIEEEILQYLKASSRVQIRHLEHDVYF